MDLDNISTVPSTPREARLLFVVVPPVFAAIAAVTSLVYSFVTLSSEAFAEVQSEVFGFALWIGASGAVGGVLFAWVQLLRYRAAGPPPSEEERLKAVLADQLAELGGAEEAPEPAESPGPEADPDPTDE